MLPFFCNFLKLWFQLENYIKVCYTVKETIIKQRLPFHQCGSPWKNNLAHLVQSIHKRCLYPIHHGFLLVDELINERASPHRGTNKTQGRNKEKYNSNIILYATKVPLHGQYTCEGSTLVHRRARHHEDWTVNLWSSFGWDDTMSAHICTTV